MASKETHLKLDENFWRGFWDGWAELLEFFPESYELTMPSTPKQANASGLARDIERISADFHGAMKKADRIIAD